MNFLIKSSFIPLSIILSFVCIETAHAISPERKAQVQHQINEHKKSIDACYESGLKKMDKDASKPEGTVTVEFFVSREGEIKSAKIDDSKLSNKGIESCILKEIRQMKFPYAKETEKIDFSFDFKAPQAPESSASSTPKAADSPQP